MHAIMLTSKHVNEWVTGRLTSLLTGFVNKPLVRKVLVFREEWVEASLWKFDSGGGKNMTSLSNISSSSSSIDTFTLLPVPLRSHVAAVSWLTKSISLVSFFSLPHKLRVAFSLLLHLHVGGWINIFRGSDAPTRDKKWAWQASVLMGC